MHLAIIGSGGREHALAWKLAQSPHVNRITTLPGNGGTALIGNNVPIPANDTKAITTWCSENQVDFVVVGPEEPLTLGLVDQLEAAGIPAFGPGKIASQLEESKAWAKAFMQRHGIPTAFSETCSSIEQAHTVVQDKGVPLVIKADGLAAGKGVYICNTKEQATQALNEIMVEGKFGASGTQVVIEEYLEGREVSFLAFVDGKTIVPMQPSCDYKRVGDGDTGLNTGGMGVYTPPGFLSKSEITTITRDIAEKTLQGLQQENIDYHGVLYIGLMMTKNGPKVLEYNVRFGDPETEVLLPALDNDLLPVLQACREGTLAQHPLTWHSGISLGIILAAGGYPGTYAKGDPIDGLENVENALVFHAGTSRDAVSGKTTTNGGRVLCVVGTGDTMKTTRQTVYNEIKHIHFPGMHYRHDIGQREE